MRNLITEPTPEDYGAWLRFDAYCRRSKKDPSVSGSRMYLNRKGFWLLVDSIGLGIPEDGQLAVRLGLVDDKHRILYADPSSPFHLFIRDGQSASGLNFSGLRPLMFPKGKYVVTVGSIYLLPGLRQDGLIVHGDVKLP